MTALVKAPVDLSRLARDIAMDVLETGDILSLHEVDEAAWEEIARSPAFEAMLRTMRADWLAADNTKARVRIKAQTGVEAVLESLLAEVTLREIPLAQRVELLKVLVKLGELGEQPAAGASGERLVIQIVTANEPPVTIEARPSRVAEDVAE